MIGQISIRPATMKDEKAIGEFFISSLAERGRYKYPERWYWLYKNNPFLGPGESLPIWLAVKKNKEIVGMACIVPQIFEIKQELIRGGWCIDFRVLSRCRGLGLGSELQKARQHNYCNFSLSSSLQSMKIKTKLGQSSVGRHIVYLNIRKLDPLNIYNDFLRYLNLLDNSVVRWMGSALQLHCLLTMILTIILKTRQRKNSSLKYKNNSLLMQFKEVDRFGDDVDLLWEDIRRDYTVTVRRDRTYLNWKFVEQPHINYQRYQIYIRNKLCGVLVYRLGKYPELPIGIISEYYTNKGVDILAQMINYAIMIQCASSTEKRAKLLEDMGFVQMRKDLTTFSLIGENAADMQKQAEDGKWLMGLGDHEHDEYPRTKHPSLKTIVKLISGKVPGEEFFNH